MINDTCDHCQRQFAYQRGARPICMTCGIENVRSTVSLDRPRSDVPETAMVVPAVERAVMPEPLRRIPALAERRNKSKGNRKSDRDKNRI